MKVIPEEFEWEAWDEAPEVGKVMHASAVVDEVIDAFYGPNEDRGAYLPWNKAMDKLRLRKREVTVYAGINGHGKSGVACQIALGLARQAERSLLCSFEMRSAQTMQRMTRQAAADDEPSIPYIRAFHRWTDDRIWLYDHFGACDPRRVLAVCRYAARELGVRHVFVDPLMKVVRDTDDYTGQKVFVGDLCSLALGFDVHVHLVAHAKKGQSELDDIDKFDVKGAGEITDQADNVVLIQRNKKKEAKVAKGVEDHSPDVWFTVAKQRHGDYEGTLGFWFDRKAGALAETPAARVAPLNLPLPAREPGEVDA